MDTAAANPKSLDRGNDFVKAFVRMSSNPWSLFFALLLINAIARPYSDLIHDARLYAVQVLDRVNPGMYSDDLYLKFGSQDKFSLFSRAIGPFVRQFGIRPAFFVFYLASNALLIYAAQRFVTAVIRRRCTAAVALIYLAVNPVTFGGLGVFHVNEGFLTPRLSAIALVLFALEQLVNQRRCFSLLFLVPALMLHPVMAFSGFLVWFCVTLTTLLTIRQVTAIAAVGTVFVAAVLSYHPLGSSILGEMDAVWRERVHAANYYAIPHKWVLLDWLRIATAFAITFAGRKTLRLPDPVNRVLDAIMFVAALGIVAGTMVPFLPYALPFQGQPYRSLWLLQFIQLPLGVALLRYVWSHGTPDIRSWAVLIGGTFAVGAMTLVQILSSMGLVLIGRFRQALTRSNQGRLGTRMSTLFVFAAIACIAPLVTPLIASWDKVQGMPSPLDLLRFVPPALGPLYTLVGSLLLLTWLYRRTGGGRKFQVATIAGCLGVQSAFFVAPHLPIWRGGFARHERDVADLREFLDENFDDRERLPTIYWPQAGLDDIWVNLRSKCYFTKQQTAGNMFNRGTAVEGQRRADLVSPFELAEFKRRRHSHRKNDWRVKSLLEIFGPNIDAEPTLEDLDRLCQEDVDILVIRHNFDDLHSTRLGPLFVYECQKIRDKVRERVSRAASSQTIPVRSNETKSG